MIVCIVSECQYSKTVFSIFEYMRVWGGEGLALLLLFGPTWKDKTQITNGMLVKEVFILGLFNSLWYSSENQ